VDTGQFVFGILIVVATAALGGYYAWQQWQSLRRLRAEDMTPDDDRRFLRNQAWRRLAGAVLLLLVAGLFVGMFFLEEPILKIERQGDDARAHGESPKPEQSQKEFVRLYVGYWIVLLLLVLGIIAIAGYELFAIRRYSVEHMRRIQDERRAMIASETARLRRERNGHA